MFLLRVFLFVLFGYKIADEFDRLREDLDKIDPSLLNKEVVSHIYYDPDDNKVLYQINREYFTLVIYLDNMNDIER